MFHLHVTSRRQGRWHLPQIILCLITSILLQGIIHVFVLPPSLHSLLSPQSGVESQILWVPHLSPKIKYGVRALPGGAKPELQQLKLGQLFLSEWFCLHSASAAWYGLVQFQLEFVLVWIQRGEQETRSGRFGCWWWATCCFYITEQRFNIL